MILCYTVPEIWHMINVIVIFHFGLFFALLTLKETKKSLDYIRAQSACNVNWIL